MVNKNTPTLSIIAIVTALLGIVISSISLSAISLICVIFAKKHILNKIAFVISFLYIILALILGIGISTFVLFHVF